ncbi:MAG: sensor histidine kinase [Pseudomonadota bacterium]|nr:sensor histidine kinase [Pseudomonadota bacterium]
MALAMALAPVLILGALQAALVFQRDAHDQRTELVDAARRSAATARAHIAAAEVLLRTLAPDETDVSCVERLAEIKNRVPGFTNLIRFNANGLVVCAAAPVPLDPLRRSQPWFQSLASGRAMAVTSEPEAGYGAAPALLASVPAHDEAGRFAGVLTAAIALASLRPEKADRSVPANSEVALADAQGNFLTTTSAAKFSDDIAGRLAGPARDREALWLGSDRGGEARLFASAPLVGHDVYVVLSAPSRGLVSWAWLNPVSAFLLPLLAFCVAVAAVLLVAERSMVRWIVYLRRIAALYGRGRYTVRPLKAHAAAPEIRALADTLETMAKTIAARDAALTEALAHKDALMREIHHRVKNNLQVISSLLNMQQRALTDPAAQAALYDTRQRIAALALIYRALYQGPDLKHIDLRDFLDELIAQLVMGESARGSPIRTQLDLDPLIIDPDQLAPLALFAVEAITNAKKHGLGEGGGILGVAFHVRGATAELTVSDTGEIGVPAEVGSGVGRTLMTAFARQLRGEVAFRANPGGGMTARLTFPAPGGEPLPRVEIPLESPGTCSRFES